MHAYTSTRPGRGVAPERIFVRIGGKGRAGGMTLPCDSAWPQARRERQAFALRAALLGANLNGRYRIAGEPVGDGTGYYWELVDMTGGSGLVRRIIRRLRPGATGRLPHSDACRALQHAQDAATQWRRMGDGGNYNAGVALESPLRDALRDIHRWGACPREALTGRELRDAQLGWWRADHAHCCDGEFFAAQGHDEELAYSWDGAESHTRIAA